MILEKLKENKKKTIFLSLILIVVFLYSFTSWVPRILVHGEALWAFDIDSDRELVGIETNVFIAKVLDKRGQKDLYEELEIRGTEFEVKVLKNIKGNLKGKIKVYQEGGYKGAFFYQPDEGGFIKEGKTYLLFTDDNIIIGDKRGHQEVVENSEKYSEKEILNQKEVNDLIKKYEEAYRNEINNISDIRHNNLKNSYKKYTDEERQEMVNKHYREKYKKMFEEEYEKKGVKISEEILKKRIDDKMKKVNPKIKKSSHNISENKK